MLLPLIGLVIILCVAWYIIGIIKLPAPLSDLKWVLYVILLVLVILVVARLFGVPALV